MEKNPKPSEHPRDFSHGDSPSQSLRSNNGRDTMGLRRQLPNPVGLDCLLLFVRFRYSLIHIRLRGKKPFHRSPGRFTSRCEISLQLENRRRMIGPSESSSFLRSRAMGRASANSQWRPPARAIMSCGAAAEAMITEGKRKILDTHKRIRRMHALAIMMGSVLSRFCVWMGEW